MPRRTWRSGYPQFSSKRLFHSPGPSSQSNWRRRLKLGRWELRGQVFMSTPTLVEVFYSRIWNDGDLAVASELLSEGFSFRGSPVSELQGRDAFAEDVRSV